jgi:hypothetical protein
MSDIRTLSDLQQEMSADFAWRKKELHNLKAMVLSNGKRHTRDMTIRAAVTLLYAHWEGFIKRVGSAYLEFVARQRLQNDELNDHFLAVAVAKIIRDATAASKPKKCLELVAFFRSEGTSRCKLPWKEGVPTKSNLKSEVLQEIVAMLGLDYSRFATKEKLLDEKLLKNRNQIAHGQYLLVDQAEYLDLHDEVLGMMQDFYNQVENAALGGGFRA